MACQTGQSSAGIINDLLERGNQYSFVQVMRLFRAVLGPDALEQGRVRVRPELSMAFPPADVAGIEAAGDDESGFLVTATFLGLYGSSSPLPSFYTEDLLDEISADGSACRDFLDIIHQRLYSLYFRCWSKYRLFIRVEEEQDPSERQKLFCLLGLGEPELAAGLPDAWSLIRYAGLLTQFPRSSLGLETLLRDALSIKELTVIQCIRRMASIPPEQRLKLGNSGCGLGTDTVLGSEIVDRMGKFRLQVGPLFRKEFDSLLPGAPLHIKLASLVKLYLLDPLDHDLELILSAGEVGPIRLGAPDCPKLGWNTWCFSGDTLGEVRAVFPVHHDRSEQIYSTPPKEKEKPC
jgi:type VI secretion system protein ImpH